MTHYDTNFYDTQRYGSASSASIVVPLLIDLFKPASVVDIGCGVGEWLAFFKRHGVEDVVGVDGEYVRTSNLAISRDEFFGADLSQPLDLNRRFDLALSLEVAEHLPPMSAQQFVDNLVTHADLIAFSAAIPFQGGTNHVNEQWPSYWSEKFAMRGYLCVDYIRRLIWEAPGMEWWYAQNLLLFVEKNTFEQAKYDFLRPFLVEKPMGLAHPKLLLLTTDLQNYSGRRLLAEGFRKVCRRLLCASSTRAGK